MLPILSVLLLILLALIAFFLITGRQALLPKHILTRIAEIQQTDIPSRITGGLGTAKNGDIEIAYQAISNDNPKDNILLINGLSHPMFTWTSEIYQPLVDAGYRVIRFDNRGLGQSNWMKNWSKENPYTLEDMATDAVAVLDDLGIEKAHIIGASMGGMISQRLAISHSERVKSLTSIMSTSHYFDKTEKNTSFQFYRDYVMVNIAYRNNLKKEENKVKLHVSIQRILRGKGDYEFNHEASILNAFNEIRNRRGFNARAGDQHQEAIKLSGSRYDELAQINVPTLVIHGTDDPLILIGQGKKYAKQISNAKTLFIKGMGHDMPTVYLPQIHAAIMENISQRITMDTGI